MTISGEHKYDNEREVVYLNNDKVSICFRKYPKENQSARYLFNDTKNKFITSLWKTDIPETYIGDLKKGRQKQFYQFDFLDGTVTIKPITQKEKTLFLNK